MTVLPAPRTRSVQAVAQLAYSDGDTVDLLRLRLLGGFQARVGNGPALSFPARKAEGLLAYLALPVGRPHPRDHLAALLWGGLGDTQARKNLRQALFTVRKVIGIPALLLDGATVALDPTAVEVDVAELERCLEARTPAALERAAALYAGDLLHGLAVQEPAFEEWLLAERERLRERALEGLARLLAQQRDAGAPEAAIATALRLLALDPLQEPVHRALMRLYVGQGRRAAALRQYQVCVAALQRELGADPDGDTQALYQDTLRRRPSRATAHLDRATAAPAVPLASSRPEGPLVGREPELAALRSLVGRAWAGDGRIVALIGEAGIGKSRLVGELASEAQARGGRVLVGRCYEAEQILSYGPWVEMLRGARLDAEPDVLGSLGVRERVELTRLLPELAGSDVVADAPDDRRLFETIAQLLRRLALQQPLVLILEDAHWADETSLRLLTFLGRHLSARVLMVATVREEDLDMVPLLGRLIEDLEHTGRLTAQRLAALSRSDTRDLVRALVSGKRADADLARLAEDVWQASEGNPFVVVEIVGTAPAEAEAAPAALPRRVQQLIARHLATLSPGARELASVAAVIGREFEFTLLARAAGLDDVQTAERLEELVRRRIVHSIADRFDFTHDRIRETTYEALLAERRRAVHRRIVEAIEALYPDRLADELERLGLHAFRGEVWDKAVRYLRQAAAKAAGRAAYRSAVASLEQALSAVDHLPTGPERQALAIDVRYELDGPLMALGMFERRMEHFREAERLCHTLGDRGRLARALAWAAQNLPFVGRTQEALAVGRRCVELIHGIDDPRLEQMARQCLGRAEWEAGGYHEAVARLRLNIEAFRADRRRDAAAPLSLPLRARNMEVVSRYWLILCLTELGEFAEADTLAGEALRLADTWDSAWNRLIAYRALATIGLRRGELERALPLALRGLELSRTTDVTYMVPTLASLAGYVLVLTARTDEGLALLEQAQVRAREIRTEAGEPLRRAQLGEGYLLAGRVDEARQVTRAAVALAEARGEQGYAAWARRVLGEVERAAGASAAAEGHYGTALAAAERLGMRPLAAHCRLGLARVYRATGRPAAADEHLAAATASFRALDMTGWLSAASAESACRP